MDLKYFIKALLCSYIFASVAISQPRNTLLQHNNMRRMTFRCYDKMRLFFIFYAINDHFFACFRWAFVVLATTPIDFHTILLFKVSFSRAITKPPPRSVLSVIRIGILIWSPFPSRFPSSTHTHYKKCI